MYNPMKYHAYVTKTLARKFNADGTLIDLCLLLADEPEMTYAEFTKLVIAVTDNPKYTQTLEYEGLVKVNGRRVLPSVKMKDIAKKYYTYMDKGMPYSKYGNPIVASGTLKRGKRGDKAYTQRINYVNEDIKRRTERYRRYGLLSHHDRIKVYSQSDGGQIARHYPE